MRREGGGGKERGGRRGDSLVPRPHPLTRFGKAGFGSRIATLQMVVMYDCTH